jgi:hypothetical protein
MSFSIWLRDQPHGQKPHWYDLKGAGRQVWGEVPSHCPVCNHQEIRNWLDPRRVTIISGNEWPDALGFDLPDGSCPVTERFRDRWAQSGLTGLNISQEPLKILRNRSTRDLDVPEYYSAQPVRSQTQIAVKPSGAVLSRPSPCDLCGSQGVLLYADRTVIKDDTWDDVDVFRPAFSRSGIVVVTRRFQEWAVENRISNVQLCPSQNFKYERPRFEWRLMGYTGPLPPESVSPD